MTDHELVSREEWAAAREELLAREKEHTRLGDELARRRRELPWVRVEKEYRFDTDDGTRTLAELFNGRRGGELGTLHAEGLRRRPRLPAAIAEQRARAPTAPAARAAGARRNGQPLAAARSGSRFAAFGVPRPVVGSHPVDAL